MNDQPEPNQRIGVVVIGRNEGQRLRRCLASLIGQASPIVYVDSGSTDGSVEHARSVGVEVIDLDLSRPFTAARARNEGLRRLLQLQPDTAFVQFIDGDCQVSGGWLDIAGLTLEADPKLAAVAGRRREQFADATVYNRLCDIEWNTPVGDAAACGGDALMRVAAVESVSGYDPDVIAAEDDDLCVRMRGKGWKVRRIDADMTLHDAAMTTVHQWWRRAQRSGHAFGQVHDKHRSGPIAHFRREHRSVIVWGGLLPLIALLLTPVYGLGIGLLVLAFGFLSWRVARHMKSRGFGGGDAWRYGIHCSLAKVPQFVGLARWKFCRWRSRQPVIIEYKGAAAAAKQA